MNDTIETFIEQIKENASVFTFTKAIYNLPFKMCLLRNITEMNISGCKIESLINLPPNIIKLNASDNLIKSIGSLPKNISVLNLSKNLIDNIDNLPENLTIVDLSHNKLTDESFKKQINADTINLSNNLLKNLSFISTDVVNLDVSNNKIEEIHLGFDFYRLKTLNCSANNIIDLQNITAAIEILDASRNKINKITYFKKTLTQINLSHNLITELNIEMPSPIYKLDLSFNHIVIFNIPNIDDLVYYEKILLENNDEIIITDSKIFEYVKLDDYQISKNRKHKINYEVNPNDMNLFDQPNDKYIDEYHKGYGVAYDMHIKNPNEIEMDVSERSKRFKDGYYDGFYDAFEKIEKQSTKEQQEKASINEEIFWMNKTWDDDDADTYISKKNQYRNNYNDSNYNYNRNKYINDSSYNCNFNSNNNNYGDSSYNNVNNNYNNNNNNYNYDNFYSFNKNYNSSYGNDNNYSNNNASYSNSNYSINNTSNNSYNSYSKNSSIYDDIFSKIGNNKEKYPYYNKYSKNNPNYIILSKTCYL